MVFTHIRIHPKNKTAKIYWDFEIQMDHPIQAKIPDLVLLYIDLRPCQAVKIGNAPM